MYLHCCLYGVLYDMFDVTLYIVQIEYLRGIHSHIKLEVYIFDISGLAAAAAAGQPVARATRGAL